MLIEIEFITFKRGVHGKGENMISKHDIALNNRHNAERVMKFPPVRLMKKNRELNYKVSKILSKYDKQ